MALLDVIILTNTIDDQIYKMTANAIKTLKNSSKLHSFNVILMESNKNSNYTYDVDHFVKPDIDFNYNSYLNIANEYCKGDFTCISNNDVIFHDKWFDKLHDAMLKHSLDTASPKSSIEQIGIVPKAEIKHRFTPLNKIVEGYHVVYTFCGWCWVMTKDVRNWIFPFDEQFKFFYQDNDVILRLQEKNCKHALIGNSIVDHFGQSSHRILRDKGTWFEHTFGLESKFTEKWKEKLK